ncbi:hypothetical protein [Oceanibaculum pacificum]|uniref:hypothetical protein n=1 Tax=Oceanibaculum pacificum TaxID=580166 RepID=UPI0018DE5873|nr:hypothetical protein [Oceanibaculum pacificum]
MLKTILILLAFALALAGAIYASATVWTMTGDADMGGHGIAALVLGVVFTFLLGAGLMGLVFYSSRKGYDRQATPESDAPLSRLGLRQETQDGVAGDRRQE